MITGSITAKPQVLAAAVKWAAKFLDARPSVPIWAGLLLETDGDTLTVTAMNENVWAVASVPVDGDGKGRAVVSGRLLNELVGTFPDKQVEISGDPNGEPLISLAAARWRGTLPTMSEDDYPDMPGQPEILGTVNGEQFARMIAEVTTATIDDPDKAANWRSVHLSFGEAEVYAIGTDSYRAAGSSVAFDHQREEPAVGATALALARPFADMAAGFIGPDQITVGLSDSQISMASASRSVVMRLMDGKEYPAKPMTAMIAEDRPEHAVVEVSSLTGPLKRAALMRDKDGPVAVGFTSGLMTIASSAGDLHRDGADEVDIDYDGPDAVLHFNPKYFADALTSAPGGRVDIALTEKPDGRGRPQRVVLTVPGTSWRHILMPIKPLG